MKYEHFNEIKAIVVLAIGLILLASLLSFVPEDLPWYTSSPNVPAQNVIRICGAYVAGALLFVIGYSAYVLAFLLFFWSWNKFCERDIKFSLSKALSFIIILASLSALFSMIGPDIAAERFTRAGIVGILISDFFVKYIGRIGTYIFLVTLAFLTSIVIGEFLWSPLLFKLTEAIQEIFCMIHEKFVEFTEQLAQERKKSKSKQAKSKRFSNLFNKTKKKTKRRKVEDDEEEEEEYEEEEDDEEYEEEQEKLAKATKPKPVAKPKIRIMGVKDKKSKPEAPAKPKKVGEYHLPSLDLLADPPEVSEDKIQDGLMSGAQTLEKTLEEFGVVARVADIERGPVITRYECEPGPGVKVTKFTTLQDDIALAMKVSAVRIVAPIPGKNRVGIEVPNGATSAVFLKDVLAQGPFRKIDSKVTLALGKDISGRSMCADLAGMPHLLIAGTTGSGKTVCVQSIIMSILFNASPQEVKFIMIDPKMVELSIYNGLPHCICPVITDSKKAASTLGWCVGEMESRYKKLLKEKVRNIRSYQAKGLDMPYIVVVIDEFADLMAVSAKAVESSVARIAQLARAVGIHLVLATQRPSVDVITGVIKANFPARISFKVASKIDSRTVLDANGAENLLGRGDMLFIKPGDAKPTRGQCSFLSDEEIHKVIEFIKPQQDPEYNDDVANPKSVGPGGVSGEKDELFEDAVKLVLETNQASVSILQRRMRLGYTRAARLIDLMEQEGIVGPYCGSKPREILVDREEWLLNSVEGEEEDEEATEEVAAVEEVAEDAEEEEEEVGDDEDDDEEEEEEDD